MAKESVTDMLRYLAKDAGFNPAWRCLLEYRFALALVAGIVVVWLGHDWLPPFAGSHVFSWKLLVALVVWQPVFEEILFRGIIQGQLLKHDRGRRCWRQISSANVITSMLFVGIHLIMNPTLVSLTVFIPSLVFGYFRDRCDSLYPSMLLHCGYNAFVFAGLIVADNMELP